MKYLLLGMLFVLSACMGNDSGSKSSEAKVTSGDVIGSQAAQAYVRNTHNQIPTSLQLTTSDLDGLSQEALLTPEEALEISANL